MKIFKKALCLLLVLCFIGTVLVGCGNKGGTSDEATPEGENAPGASATAGITQDPAGGTKLKPTNKTLKVTYEGKTATMDIIEKKLNFY